VLQTNGFEIKMQLGPIFLHPGGKRKFNADSAEYKTETRKTQKMQTMDQWIFDNTGT